MTVFEQFISEIQPDAEIRGEMQRSIGIGLIGSSDVGVESGFVISPDAVEFEPEDDVLVEEVTA